MIHSNPYNFAHSQIKIEKDSLHVLWFCFFLNRILNRSNPKVCYKKFAYCDAAHYVYAECIVEVYVCVGECENHMEYEIK